MLNSFRPQINAILHILNEVDNVYALHLSKVIFLNFQNAFVMIELSLQMVFPKTWFIPLRLNGCIKETVELISTFPSTKVNMECFLNPQWKR